MAETNITEKKEPSTLSKSLNIGMDSMPTMGQTKEGREYAATAKPLMDKAAEAAGEVKRAEIDQQVGMLGAQAQASRQFGEKTKDLYQQTENKELEYPRPEFHPTKENAESLGQLFSMVSTFGLMLGGSGKLASQNALGAMTGMLQGWQKGRKDLYEREVREFDKEYKRVQDIRTDIQNRLQKSLQLASTDKETASLEAQQAAAIAGSSSIVGTMINQGKTQRALTLLQTTQNIDDKVRDRQQRAAQHAENLQMQRDRIQAQKDIATLKATGEGVKGALPKDKETKKIYASRYQTIKTLEEIETLLKDPKYANLINPGTKFIPDVMGNLQEGYPELTSKLARLTAGEFEIGGKSLTKSEQEKLGPIFEWRGLTVDALNKKINEAKNYIQNENKMTEVYYPGFKEFHPQFDAIFKQSGKVPIIPDDVGGGQQSYQLNQIIDRGGKKYRVVGGSANDPDIEEVK
jgi:hypothetical protein